MNVIHCSMRRLSHGLLRILVTNLKGYNFCAVVAFCFNQRTSTDKGVYHIHEPQDLSS